MKRKIRRNFSRLSFVTDSVIASTNQIPSITDAHLIRLLGRCHVDVVKSQPLSPNGLLTGKVVCVTRVS